MTPSQEATRADALATLTTVLTTLTLAQLKTVGAAKQPVTLSGEGIPPLLQMLPSPVFQALGAMDSVSFGNCDGKQAMVTALITQPPSGDGTTARTNPEDRASTHTISVHRANDIPGRPPEITQHATCNAPVNQLRKLRVIGGMPDGKTVVVPVPAKPGFLVPASAAPKSA